jgi:multidrug efflux system membrane fusion protein
LRPVRYHEVAPALGDETRNYSGTTQAQRAIDLSFRVGGTLAERLVDVGASVAAGQNIGRLETADFEARLREAQARRAAADAAVANAEANFQRVSQLFENQGASESDYDAARTARESAIAQRDAAVQQLQAANLQLTYTELIAPQAQQCAVAQVFAEANQNVSPGQPIVRLNCGECEEVLVNVPEVDIDRIEGASAIRVSINALGLRNLSGLVSEIGVDTGQGSSTFPVTVAIQEQCDAIRAGMAAEVSFDLQRPGPAGSLIVPLVAVGEDRDMGQNFVYMLEPAAETATASEIYVARKRSVTIGEPTTSGLVILDGLEPGDLIATAGFGRLYDGQRVTLLDRDDLNAIP